MSVCTYIQEQPKIVSPLLEHVSEEKGVLKIAGNMALASVSLACECSAEMGMMGLCRAVLVGGVEETLQCRVLCTVQE